MGSENILCGVPLRPCTGQQRENEDDAGDNNVGRDICSSLRRQVQAKVTKPKRGQAKSMLNGF